MCQQRKLKNVKKAILSYTQVLRSLIEAKRKSIRDR